jgi:cytochrome c oxidase assembly protein subunit 15
MSDVKHSKALTRFAWATALMTLCLIGLGAIVTSKEAGMAVPDWPTSNGYNMFALPFSHWVGGILYEHSHRLVAAFVGLLTAILAAWIWGRERQGRTRWFGWMTIMILVAMLGHRGSGVAEGGANNIPAHFKLLAAVMPALIILGVIRCFKSRGSLRWLAMTAFFTVILQGILGGLRVTLYMPSLGIFHGMLAQAFLVLMVVIALRTTQWWRSLADRDTESSYLGLRGVFATLTVLIFVQLIVGATMRHQHAGLAVPDFPLAYGQVWPATDEASLNRINAHRTDTFEDLTLTPFHIHIHMAHRIGALLIFAMAFGAVQQAFKRAGKQSSISKLSLVWFGMIAFQAVLGAATVWSNKAADIASLHVVLGAGCLVLGSGITLITMRLCPTRSRREPALEPVATPQSGARVSAA